MLSTYKYCVCVCVSVCIILKQSAPRACVIKIPIFGMLQYVNNIRWCQWILSFGKLDECE